MTDLASGSSDAATAAEPTDVSAKPAARKLSTPKIETGPEALKQIYPPTGDRTIFSFVVDTKARFAYEGWHLARSLIKHCGGDPTAVHVQCTPEVKEVRRNIFRQLGCTVHEMQRFGDGKHCNKLNQLETLRDVAFDRVVLLDADTIATADIRQFLRNEVILGKPVDASRPPLAALDEIAEAAGMEGRPGIWKTDIGTEGTYAGNCNGGFYSIPKAYADALSDAWRKWALWLFDNVELLKKYDMPEHVDQVSFWLALHMAKLPFDIAPANLNFFPYIGGEHLYLDTARPIALVHYHSTLNRGGRLETHSDGRTEDETAAIGAANRQFASGFHSRLFWDFRYERYPGAGPGALSQGQCKAQKQQLLLQQGIESAESVLDIGCGDLRVVRPFQLKNYVGTDISVIALKLARRARPKWDFRMAPAPNAPLSDMVLCLDVLISQPTEAEYLQLIRYAVGKTNRCLLISGFDENAPNIARDPALAFYEPLRTSLLRVRRFKTVEPVGTIGPLVLYRCDV